jgi:GNAT superfamily N-acetyltransferase
MEFREAILADIPQIQIVRNSVTENTLSDPALVSDIDCALYMTTRGKAWVCEIDNQIVGFAYIDLIANNVWALFVQPGFDRQGIGKTLHQLMLDWYFEMTEKTIWLSTSPGTRAETFYRLKGWKEAGQYGKGETRFEMDRDTWQNKLKS